MPAKEKHNQNNTEQKRICYCWYKAVDSFTPPEKLAEYANDPSPMIRRTVACNLNTARETVIELSKDENGEVADAAKKHLELLNKYSNTAPLEP